MATLYLNARDFYLKSTWTGTESGSTVRYTTPSIAREYVTYAASQLPRGAAVQQAILRVSASIGYTGGILTVNGSTALEQEVTRLFIPDSAGNYPDLTLAFTYRAYGGQGGEGSHMSTTHVHSAVITVTYEAGDSQAADTRAALWRAACAPSRGMAPFAALYFPDGSEQALGPGEIVSFQLDEGCGDGPLLGQAPAAVLSLRLANAGHEWYPGGSLRGSRALLGASVIMRMRVQTELGPVQVPLGTFYIDEMRGDENDAYLELRGFDAMANVLENVWNDTTSYPAMLTDILANIAAAAGIGVEGVLACNRSQVISRKPDWGEGCTLRRALMQVCGAGGAYAYITRTGRLGIAPARPDYGDALAMTAAHYMQLRHDEREFVFNRVTAWPRGTADPEDAVTDAVDAALPARPQNTLTLRNNALLTGGNAQTQALLGGLKTMMTGARWQALRLTWRGDPQQTVGRAIFLTDQDGRVLRSFIAGQSLCWDRGFFARAVCRVDFS